MYLTPLFSNTIYPSMILTKKNLQCLIKLTSLDASSMSEWQILGCFSNLNFWHQEVLKMFQEILKMVRVFENFRKCFKKFWKCSKKFWKCSKKFWKCLQELDSSLKYQCWKVRLRIWSFTRDQKITTSLNFQAFFIKHTQCISFWCKFAFYFELK